MARNDALAPSLVRIGLKVMNREELLRFVADELHRSGNLTEAEEPYRRLVEREQVQSTALGGGIALPHARTPAAAEHRLAVIRLLDPVDFHAPDGKPVDLVFLLLGPPDAPGTHVKILGRIARRLREPGVLEHLRQAADEEEVREILQDGATVG